MPHRAIVMEPECTGPINERVRVDEMLIVGYRIMALFTWIMRILYYNIYNIYIYISVYRLVPDSNCF